MSFPDSEVDAFNKLYFIKHELNTDQVDSLGVIMEEIGKLLSKRIDYYTMDLPDVLFRYLIYKLTDMNDGKEIYYWEEGAVWGESLTQSGTLQWTPGSSEYSVDTEGIEQLTQDLISRCEKRIRERRYGGIIGTVMEELDHGTVKIKLKKPGLLKKKMNLHLECAYYNIIQTS